MHLASKDILETNFASSHALSTIVFITFIVIGSWLLIRGITVRHIPNMVHYNYKALSERNIYEMDRDSTGTLNQKLLRARVMVAHKDMRNRTFVILGIIAALALYALPSLETPYFWIAFVGAFIACKISSGFAYRQVCTLFSEPPHDYEGRDQDK